VSIPKSTVKPTRFKGSGEPSKPSQLGGGQKKRRSSRTKQETKTPSKLPGSVSRETLAFLPNVSKVPSFSAVKGFLLEKGQSEKTELPPGPKAKHQREKDKVRMALSAPPNYQQEAKEIPLYGDIDSEEETPKSIPRAKEGTPPLSDSRSNESKCPDGGSATSEGEPGEDCSGLALTQLGSTSTPEHLVLGTLVGCAHMLSSATSNS
jgi:hypothetical protein